MSQVQPQTQTNEDGIIWICSYPKSGNTWMRLLLGNYFFAQGNTPFTINTVQNVIRGDVSLRLYRDACIEKGWDIEESLNDIEKRKFFMENYISNNEGSMFLKSHSCFHSIKKVPYFGRSFTKGFISIVRDPRDVLCSYARHQGETIDDTFEAMTNENYLLISKANKGEYVSSWENHVKSFIGLDFPTIIIRYEDLLKDTKKILGSIAMTLHGSVDEKKLDFAVQNSSFSTLQEQEEKEGFREASEKADKFFASGKSGGWKETLTAKQAKAVEEKFEKTMKQFGYL